MDPEQQELEEQLRQLNEAISSFTGAVGDIIRPINLVTQSVNNVNNAENNNTESVKQNTGSVDRLAEANKKAAEIGNAASQNISASLSSLVGAAKTFSQTVLSNEEGFSKYGNTIGQVGNASLQLGSSFGALGTVLGLLGFGLSKVAEQAMKQADGLLKGLDALSDIGAAGQITSKELYGMAHRMGLTSQNIEIFTKAANRARTSMVAFDGSAGDGLKAFARMAAVTKEQRMAFQRLGVSQEELMNRMADYIELQNQSGLALDKNAAKDGSAQKHALEYAETISIISDITGRNAEEAKKGMLEAKANYDIQIHQARLQAKLNDPKTSKEEAEQIKKRLLIEDQLINAAEQTGDKQYLAAVRSKIATGAYTETSAVLIRQKVDIDKIINEQSKRSVQDLENEKGVGQARAALLDQTRKGYEDNIKTLGNAMTFNADMANKFGSTLEMNSYMAKNAATDFTKQGEEARAAIGDPSKGKTNEKVAEDPAQIARNKMTQLQIEAGQKMDDLILSMNPLLGNNGMLTAFAVAAGLVTAAFGAIIAVKTIAAGKQLLSFMTGGGAAAEGAAAAGEAAAGAAGAVNVAEDQLLDKKGKPLRGAARTARINKLTGGKMGQLAPAPAKKQGFGEALKSIANALKEAGKVAPQIILGAGALATAIAEFGAGIAGAVYIIGKALPSLSTGLKSFNAIKGENLKQAGLGMAGLGVGILAMGAGAMVNALGTIVRFFTGDKDPLTQASEMLLRLQKMNLNRKKIEDNGASLMAFAKAMAAVSVLGAGAGIADAVKGLFGGISKLFGTKPPYKDLEEFAKLKIDTARVKVNSDAFVYYAKAMASYKGSGGLGGIAASLAQASASFFKVKPPVEQALYFSKLKIDPKQTRINSSAFVEFSHAMAAYQGGAGLLDAISTIAGAKLGSLFGVDGPLESFKKFSEMEVGPKAAENAQAFLNFSKAMGILSGGGGTASNSGGILSSLASGAASVVGGIAGAAGSAVSTGLGALGAIGGAVAGAVSTGYQAIKGAAGSFGNWIMDKVAGHEGVRYKPYKDSLGLWTVGVGHLIGDGRSLPAQYNRQFSHDEVKAMFQQDYQKHAQAATNIPGFNRQNEKAKGALIDMTFNMGPAWYRKWPNFTKALGAGDNEGAASQLQSSKWAKQVGRRAQENIGLIRQGALKAKTGGMFAGPSTGYPMELHGTELVIPLEPNSILTKLASTSADAVAKDMSKDVIKAVPKPTSTTGTPKKTKGISKEMIHAMSIKFDRVINKIETTNHVQKKLLKHAL